MVKGNISTLSVTVSMKGGGPMVRWKGMDIWSMRMTFTRDNSKMTRKLDLESSTLAVEIVTLDSTRMINSMVKENTYGLMGQCTLVTFVITTGTILASGPHPVAHLKYT